MQIWPVWQSGCVSDETHWLAQQFFHVINQLATDFHSKISSGACEGGGGDQQNRRIFDKVDGAVGGARGESGLYSVQPPVCWPEELNVGGFERPVPTRVDHLRGQVDAADSDSSSLVLDASLRLGSISSL